MVTANATSHQRKIHVSVTKTRTPRRGGNMGMTALDLVRRIRANPKGSDFQDVRHVEEYVNQRITERLKARLELLQVLIEEVQSKPDNWKRIHELLKDYNS